MYKNAAVSSSFKHMDGFRPSSVCVGAAADSFLWVFATLGWF